MSKRKNDNAAPWQMLCAALVFVCLLLTGLAVWSAGSHSGETAAIHQLLRNVNTDGYQIHSTDPNAFAGMPPLCGAAKHVGEPAGADQREENAYLRQAAANIAGEGKVAIIVPSDPRTSRLHQDEEMRTTAEQAELNAHLQNVAAQLQKPVEQPTPAWRRINEAHPVGPPPQK